MTDLLLQIGLSNLCISVLLAIVAWAVQRSGKHPSVAHLLWLLVLAKLVTPPVMTLPLIALPGSTATAAAPASLPVLEPATVGGALLAESSLADVSGPQLEEVGSALGYAMTGLALVWLLGSACVMAWSLVRIVRFDRLLRRASRVAPRELQERAVRIAQCLGLRSIPTIYTTSAHLSPLVWWIGGRVRILVPAALQREMDGEQLRWVLAHELAHVRRRDHLVRWLEWLACIAFWWNPVAWWARRNLRANEEICCDALVLSTLKPAPRTYANSLLRVVEYLAAPTLRPPAMASEINSDGFLERRFRMIVSEAPIHTRARWLRACIALVALALMPLGLTYAQSPDYEAVGKRLKKAVAAGELSEAQARAMFEALRKADGARKDQEMDRAKRYLTELREKLGAAVRSGEISREDAAKKLEAAKREVEKKMAAERRLPDARKGDGSERARLWLEQVRKEFGEAVRAGEISREEAAEKYAAAEKRIAERMAAGRAQRAREEKSPGERRRITPEEMRKALGEQGEQSRGEARRRMTLEDYRRIEAELKRAVKSGRITAEQAQQRLGRARLMIGEQSGRGRRRITPEAYRRAEVEIKKAVEAGKVSERDARQRLEEMRRMVGERGEQRRRITREDYVRISKELKKAVVAGRITEEQARKRLESLRKRSSGRLPAHEQGDPDARVDRRRLRLEAAAARVRAEVEAGRMTPEEGRAKLAEIRRAASAKRKDI